MQNLQRAFICVCDDRSEQNRSEFETHSSQLASSGVHTLNETREEKVNTLQASTEQHSS